MRLFFFTKVICLGVIKVLRENKFPDRLIIYLVKYGEGVEKGYDESTFYGMNTCRERGWACFDLMH